MKHTLLLFAALSLFLASCDPEPTPEPEENPLVDHIYVTVDLMEDPFSGIRFHGGYYFYSDNKVNSGRYIDSIFYPDDDTVSYTYDYPIIEIEGIQKLKINDSYTEMHNVNYIDLIYKKVK